MVRSPQTPGTKDAWDARGAEDVGKKPPALFGMAGGMYKTCQAFDAVLETEVNADRARCVKPRKSTSGDMVLLCWLLDMFVVQSSANRCVQLS